MVATDLFMKHGYEATSMSSIAARLGVTKAALYRHALGKAELFASVTLPARTAVLSLVESAKAEEAPAIDRLIHLARELVRLAENRTSGFYLLWGHAAGGEPAEQITACTEAVHRALVDLLEQAAAEGTARGDIPFGIAARLILGSIAEISLSYRSVQGEFANDVAALLLNGMSLPARTGCSL
ncbi:TetR/AcrR family transcriptional regulator [Streptomyces sp. NBC_01351]|uniref:TetR/AcrR family transcriptional regulator n=1 Tax=Streptomyces sp. NBC_01351 TaxID=2903833 RepID=UPI002E34ADB1|nr:TetR/AcrR family transcriptional regulator [Streptomyces sp. NBC_01351]